MNYNNQQLMINSRSMKVYNNAGENCYADGSLVVYDFRINGEEQHVVVPPDLERNIIIDQLFVVIDCTWDTDRNILDFVVWNPDHAPLSDFASSGGYITGVTMITPDNWIYAGDVILYDVHCNQAKTDGRHSIGGGTILILDKADFNDCLDFGVLSARGEFDPIVSRAMSESGGTICGIGELL